MDAQLETMLRARQQYLWDCVVRAYGIDHSLNEQVHKWIDDGVVSAKSITARSRKSATQTAHAKQ